MNRDPAFLSETALVADEAMVLPDPKVADREGTRLLDGAACTAPAAMAAAQTAVLVGFAQGGSRPMILRSGCCVAEEVESVLLLGGEHIGRRLAIVPFSGAEAGWLAIGLLAGQPGWSDARSAAVVEVEADGRRLTVVATEEISLRCGKAILRLRADGRVEIRGETIVSEAVRTNRVRGGSVELN